VNIRHARLAAIRACCPELAQIISEFADAPLQEYAARLWRPTASPPASQQSRLAFGHVRSALQRTLLTGAHLTAEETESALRQFARFPVFQTADHAQLLLDPVSFHTNLLYYLGALSVGASALFVNACSTVTLETRQGQGPGWLNIRGTRINLFALARRSLTGFSVCAAPGPFRFRFDVRPGPSSLTLSEDSYLSRVRALLGDEAYESAGDAFAAANLRLWRSWDQPSRTTLIYTDDRLVASIIADSLEDEESLIGRLLFEPPVRERLDQELARARRGVGRFALRDSTQYFWGVRGGRVRALRLINGNLLETGAEQGCKLAFRRETVARALLEGRLYPDLFTGFLALAVLPRIKVLGGSSQEIYLRLIAEVCARTLASLGDEFRDLQDEILSGPHDDPIAGMIEGAAHPLSLLAEHPAGLQLESISRLYAHTSLAQSMGELSLFDYLREWANVQTGTL
jgi:hypothetical protein